MVLKYKFAGFYLMLFLIMGLLLADKAPLANVLIAPMAIMLRDLYRKETNATKPPTQ